MKEQNIVKLPNFLEKIETLPEAELIKPDVLSPKKCIMGNTYEKKIIENNTAATIFTLIFGTRFKFLIGGDNFLINK